MPRTFASFLSVCSVAPYESQLRSRDYSTGNWNFKQEDIRLLTDDARDARGLPTKANILNAMKWLVQDARAHDSLFIHCECALYCISQTAVYLRFLDSGHGGQIRDRDGDEVDGFDECV